MAQGGGRSKRGKKLQSRHSSWSDKINTVLFSSATGSCSVNQVVSRPSSVTWEPVSLWKMSKTYFFICFWPHSQSLAWVNLIRNQKLVSNIQPVRTDIWHKFLKYFFCVLLCLTLLQSYRKLCWCEGSVTFTYQNIFPQLKKCAGFNSSLVPVVF